MAISAGDRGELKVSGRKSGGRGMHGAARAVTAMGTVRHTGGHAGGVGMSMGRGSKRSSRKSSR